jgi:hypothetical protein
MESLFGKIRYLNVPCEVILGKSVQKYDKATVAMPCLAQLKSYAIYARSRATRVVGTMIANVYHAEP